MRHKSAGYAVYFMIIERLRDEADYMSIKDYNVLAFDFRESAELVKSVVEDFGLFEFTEDRKKFYSLSFMERMEQMKLFSESGKKGGGNPNFKKGESNPYYQKDKGIDKPPLSSEINKETKLNKTKLKENTPLPPTGDESEFYPFDEFWNDYDKKVGSLEKIKLKWKVVSKSDREKIKLYLPLYKSSRPDKQYRKNADTFLNQKGWNDEIIDPISKKQSGFKKESYSVETMFD